MFKLNDNAKLCCIHNDPFSVQIFDKQVQISDTEMQNLQRNDSQLTCPARMSTWYLGGFQFAPCSGLYLALIWPTVDSWARKFLPPSGYQHWTPPSWNGTTTT